MAAEHLKRSTPEELAAMQEAGRIARSEKAAFNKANEHLYKLNYMDSVHWQELASKYKVRMPVHNEPASAKGIRKYLKRVGVSNDVWKEHYTSIDYFLENNPRWTLYGAAGLMLELREGM